MRSTGTKTVRVGGQGPLLHATLDAITGVLVDGEWIRVAPGTLQRAAAGELECVEAGTGARVTFRGQCVGAVRWTS